MQASEHSKYIWTETNITPMANGFLVLLLLFIFSTFVTNIHACNQTERSSLQSFALTLSTSTPLNWTSGDCCRWEGISCNRGGSVTHLSLPSKGLKLKGGDFPSSSLENLTHLTHLNLSRNSLDGSIEPSSGFFLSLSHLEVLDLSCNLLSGELPLSLPSINIQIVDCPTITSMVQFHLHFFSKLETWLVSMWATIPC